jgi:hypothetical protein
MRVKNLCVLVALSLCAAKAGAAGVTIPAGSANDMVYDGQRDIVYVTNGNEILRYQVGKGTMLSPIVLSGSSLIGIDLSPDSKTLAVADQTHTSQARYLHLIDLSSLVDNKHTFPTAAYLEGGTYSVAYGFDGDIVVSETFDGSGWPPIRHYDAKTQKWGYMGGGPYEFTQDSMLSASGDGKVIAFENSNISDGEWGTYNLSTGQLVHRTGYTDGTSTFNYTIATNAHGDQFVIDNYFIYDGFYKQQKTKVTGSGTVYDPVRPLAYMPQFATGQVNIVDMGTLQTIGTLDTGSKISFASAFGRGRSRISRDGSLLMVITDDGVFADRLYAPLAAVNTTASVTAGSSVTIPVSATLGVPGAFTFGVAKKPPHGTATVNGNTVIYTPDYSFSGTETFTYQAHYSQAVANGKITVAVSPSINQPPVAVDDYANLWSTSPALIDVLANDSDPERQALSIIAVAKPSAGTVAIQGNKLVYTPPASGYAITNFKYTISDGHGGTTSALVYVVVRKIR